MNWKLSLAVMALAGFTSSLFATTFTVSNNNPSGPGSLSQAILDANANPGPDIIAFSLPAGSLLIAPTDPLPAITDPVTIDGSTQPGYVGAPLVQISGANIGASANGFVIGTSNCLIRALSIGAFSGDDYYTGDAIQITNGCGSSVQGCYLGVAPDGATPFGNSGAGVRIGAELYFYGPITSNNVIGGDTPGAQNLISANATGVYVENSMCNTIQGNVIGTDITGSYALGNTNGGITIDNYYSTGNLIGGTNVGQGNLISGNGVAPYYNGNGIQITGGQTNAVYGNFIGVDATGTYAITNNPNGVAVYYGDNNLIGGSATGQGNLISGNANDGVLLGEPLEESVVGIYGGTPTPLPYGNVVQGNLIGTDVTGQDPISNQHDGVEILNLAGNLVGGFLPGEGNVINYNQQYGVEVSGNFGSGNNNEIAGNLVYSNLSTGVAINRQVVGTTILSNSIYANGNLGIDLNEDGVTPNHLGGPVLGDANYDQNFPVLGFPSQYATQTIITGTLNSDTNATYYIELYENDTPDPSGYGQGQYYLTGFYVNTDTNGDASFSYTNPSALPLSQWITATATDASGDTSEFSLARQVVPYNSVDLAVTFTGTTNPAPKSVPFVYTITVTNNGPADATGVVVSDPLPPGMSYVSATSTLGTCTFSANALTCNISSLPAGAGAVITLTVNALVTANYSDSISAFANESDNNLANNYASLTTFFGLADLAVLTSDHPDPVVAGQPVTYTVVTTNLGLDTASGVYTGFSLDSSMVVTRATVSQGTVSPPGNSVTASFNTIPANGSATLTVIAIPTQVGDINNYAYIGASEADPDSANNNTNQITDVLAGPGVIEFAQPFYTVVEGNHVQAQIGVTRLGGAIGSVSVNFATSNLTAIAVTDYIATNGTLTFASGVSNEIFTVTILDDGTTKCNQELNLRLSAPTGGAILLVQTNATLQIFNDHPDPSGIVQAVSLADTNVLVTGNGPSGGPSISDNGRYVAFESAANNLVLAPASGGNEQIYVHDRQSGSTTLASLDLTGTLAGNSYSEGPQITSDGSEIVFISGAGNLTTNGTPVNTQTYARNLVTGLNQLVSVNTNGVPGNSYSTVFTVSTNDTQIAFQSDASDLAPGDANNTVDIFYRDLRSNSVVLVSENQSGTGSGNSFSESPQISANGQYVAFFSYATDLCPGVPIQYGNIFRRNIAAATTQLVSANPGGVAGNSSCGSDVFISGDGRYVAFESSDTDLAPGANIGYEEVFLRDLTSGTTIVVSVNNSNAVADSSCTLEGLSRDGRYILFATYAQNLVTNGSFNQQIFVRDVVAGTTTLVTANLSGAPGNGYSYNGLLNSDGRYVIFLSLATDLVTAAKLPNNYDIFVRDLVAGTTTMQDTVYNGTAGGNNSGAEFAISPAGVAAFGSYSSNLAPLDENGTEDIFARAPSESSPELVSQGVGVTGDNNTFDQRVTGDGTKVAFASNAGDLVPNDTNELSDIFLYDLNTRATTLVSANAAGTGSQDGASDSPRPSADGHFVAYHNFEVGTPFTGPGIDFFDSAYDQIYLHDTVSNLTTLISVNQTNTAPGNNSSINPQITPSGQYVVFESQATDLASNAVTSVNAQVFIRNRTNATAELVSVTPDGTGPGNGDSHSPAVSADGRYVAFETYASNLGPADSNGHFDVYVRDRLTGTNILCSPNSSGTSGGNNDSFGALISSNGNLVVFFSYATDLIPGGTYGGGDVFAFNLTTRTLSLVSANTNNAADNNSSFEPALSANGRYVAFYSTASDLTSAPNENGQQGDVYVRDLVAGTTTLASINCESTATGNGYSEYPQLSADGRYVTFHSYATDLVPGVFTLDSGSIFRRDLQNGVTVLVSQGRSLLGEGNGNSYSPYLSDSGAVVSFLSSASDLVFGDANGVDDAFAWNTGLTGVDLAITMNPSAVTVAQGGALSYTLTVTNYGLTTATSVVVTDALPAGLSYVSATTTQGTHNDSGGVFICNLGTLAVGSGAQITLNTTATAAGYVTNTATTAAAQSDFNLANNTATALVQVTAAAASGSPALTFTVTNTSQIFLSWPYPSTGYVLQTTTNLVAPANWQTVTNPTTSNNGLLNYVTLNINPSEPTRFYRLYQP